MNKKVLLPLLVLGGAFALMLVLISMRPKPEKKPHQPKPVLVETLVAQPGEHQVWLESQGAVSPLRQSSLTARVSGTVIETSPHFLRGGFFHQGEVLLRLDPTDLQVALTRAEASLASRKAQLAAELAKAEQARKDWKAGGKGKPSPLVLRQPYVDEARAAVKAAEADLAQAQANLERSFIRAPYDGLVLQKNVDVGQFVSIGTTLGSIAATDVAEIRLPLTEAELAMLPLEKDQAQQPIPVILQQQVGERLLQREAVLQRTEAVADDNTRTVYAVARLLDPYLRQDDARREEGGTPLLRFGSFVHARLPGRIFANTYELPRHVRNVQGQIHLADEAMVLHIRSAHVIAEYGDRILVDQGIRAGERVVLTPIPNAVEGMQLQEARKTGAPSPTIDNTLPPAEQAP